MSVGYAIAVIWVCATVIVGGLAIAGWCCFKIWEALSGK